MSLKFYEVDQAYINYLKSFDRQIPDISYDKYNKFVCGIVLSVGGYNYFAPVSSFNKQQATNLLITDKGRPISSVRFCFMFPAPDEVIKLKDFTTVPPDYLDLLNAEVKFCNKNIADIEKMANKVYKIGSNRNNPLAYTCCDFKLLENKCTEFVEALKVSSVKEAASAYEKVQDDVAKGSHSDK